MDGERVDQVVDQEHWEHFSEHWEHVSEHWEQVQVQALGMMSEEAMGGVGSRVV